jgi:hypothetical protein
VKERKGNLGQSRDEKFGMWVCCEKVVKRVKMFQDLVSLTAQYGIDEASFSKALPKASHPLLITSLSFSLSNHLLLSLFAFFSMTHNSLSLSLSLS